MAKNFWLMKTEPDSFSIEDLEKRPGKKEHWDGVRNYQARNYMRDQMSVGDDVLFYHSSCKPAGVVGVAKIAKAGYPDPSALNPESKYFDPKATDAKNPWVMVDVKLQMKFKAIVSLEILRKIPDLENMVLLKRGSRLSIQPVLPEEFAIILKLADL